MKRTEPTLSEDPICEASSSSTSSHRGDYEGGNKRPKGNDHEVFLSFKGEDTRKGFTDYLYTSLIDAGVHVFRDDNELRVGEKIGPELLCSITQSTISIPIISENYASSKWCLCELAMILKCKRIRGQIVLPIFYKVSPSNLKRGLGDAINAHKKNSDEMVVQEWKEALKEVISLKGWESEKINNGHEGTLVKIIVKKVMGELKRFFQLNVPEQLVGVNDHVEQIMSKINGKFSGTRIIGIYGMGGIGKTALAKVLYNNLSYDFYHCSFLANIRETSWRQGITHLQKQLICDTIGSSCDVSNDDEALNVIKARFTSKKVLVLLDDIDEATHLKYLVGDGSWFEGGSIVIITTRNKRILDVVEASYKYQLNELPFNQSLILFSRHAFRKDYPPCDFQTISCNVVSTTGGLPLAIEVIGSFLCGRNEEIWKDTLKKLKKVPHEKVQEKLKISYEALNFREKQIFLDIACFFIGSSPQNPTYMWDACDFHPRVGLEELSLMSLIKFDVNGKLQMHDQLRDLGREIVYLENLKEAQQPSRLWNCEEALEVLDSNEGTRKIEALSLGKYGMRRRFTAEQFRGMTNLRFLQIDGANVAGDFRGLLPQLRWLQWKHCPWDFAATNFHPKKLVVLDLSESAISEDWGGWTSLEIAINLKVLNLSNCQNLRRTPDLSALKSLKSLDISHWYDRGDSCHGLEEIHPSIGELTSLTELNLSRTRIKKLPESIGNLQNLRILEIYETQIRELPDAIGMLAKLQQLDASYCQDLERLPSNVGGLVSLEKLGLEHVGISGLPENISKLSSLQVLDLWCCGKVREIPKLPSGLRYLNITCQSPSLPPLSQLYRLEHLNLVNCPELAYLPELPTGLLELRTFCCEKLKGSRNLSDWNQHVHVGHYPKASQLDGLLDLPSSKVPQETNAASGMSSVDICNYTSSGHLLDLSSLKSLKKLVVERCKIITEIRVLDGLESLRAMYISECSSLKSLHVLNLKNLQRFVCWNCENLVEIQGLEGLVDTPNFSILECPSLRQPLDPLS